MGWWLCEASFGGVVEGGVEWWTPLWDGRVPALVARWCSGATPRSTTGDWVWSGVELPCSWGGRGGLVVGRPWSGPDHTLTVGRFW